MAIKRHIDSFCAEKSIKNNNHRERHVEEEKNIKTEIRYIKRIKDGPKNITIDR